MAVRTPGAGVIVLSGASLTGKSTLGGALLPELGGRWLLVEGDRFAPAMTPEVAESMRDAGAHRQFALAMHRSALTWAECGYSLILDGTLPSPGGPVLAECLGLLAHYRPMYVGVDAAPEALRRRAALRANSDLQWSLAQREHVHDGVPLTIRVDTSELDTADVVDAVLSAWSSHVAS